MIWDWTTNKPIIIVPACGQKVWGGEEGGGGMGENRHEESYVRTQNCGCSLNTL